MLTVGQARTTMAQATLAPVESVRKIFVFDEAGVMSEGAANALLKTLEEPNATTAFILVADSDEDLPATLGSRCRIIHFGRVDEAEVVAALEAGGWSRAGDRGTHGGRRAGARVGHAARGGFVSPRLAGRTRPGFGETGRLLRPRRGVARWADPLLAGWRSTHWPSRQARRNGSATTTERARAARLGVEILASWYLDAAAVQFGATPRNRDLDLTDLTEVPPDVAVQRPSVSSTPRSSCEPTSGRHWCSPRSSPSWGTLLVSRQALGAEERSRPLTAWCPPFPAQAK